MSYRRWKIEHFANVETADLPGYRKRLYKYTGSVHLPHGVQTIILKFVVAVHFGKNDTVFEIFHNGVEDNNSVWTPLSPSAFMRLFKGENGEWFFGKQWTHSWTSHAKVVVKDDRVLIKFTKDYIRKQIWGINLDTISSTLPAFLVSDVGKFMALAEKYPGIDSMGAAETVWKAFDEYHTTEWEIMEGYYEKQRDHILQGINDAQKELESCEDNLQKVCDGAADALNVLSQKFGIEVSL